MRIQRREFLKALGAVSTTAAVPGCATMGASAQRKVVVVGGGYGGATAAKYIRMWSNGTIDVTVIEPNTEFISCPLSNLVLGGSKQIADVTVSYDNLVKRHGVKMVRDMAVGVDADKRVVKLAGGSELPYDRLILSPAIDFMWDKVPGLNNADAQAKILHSWKAGPQTVALRKQLEAMPDGGVFAISIPVAPYRCPPGPYERACQVAWYFKQAKPKSKVLILDGNGDVTSKAGLFKKAWAEEYKGIVEYRPNYVLTDVDARTLTAKFETQDDVKASVLNVLPPQRAAAIARSAGVVTRERSLVRSRFPDVRIGQGQERPRPRRRDPDRGGNAQVGSHGEPAREGVRRGGRRTAVGAAAQSGAGADQHVLQLHHRHRRRPRVLGAPVRRREEDVPAGAGRGWRVTGDERRRRRLCVRLGDEHLGRHARLNRRSDCVARCVNRVVCGAA